MPCPCCRAELTLPPAFVLTHSGDEYCFRCEWVLTAETIKAQEPLPDLSVFPRCPKHGPTVPGFKDLSPSRFISSTQE
jgi:hypothetical protein